MKAARVLIVRLSAIGDVVHVLPALAALRAAMPQAHLAWIVESLSAPLLQGHPVLDELIVYPRAKWRRRGYLRSLPDDMRRFFGEMRRRRFDVAVDFQGLTKSALIPRLSGVPKRIGYGGEDGRELSRWFYTDRLAPPDAVAHVVDRNLYLLRGLGITSPSVEFPLPDFSAEIEPLRRRLKKHGIDPDQGYVFLNPGAGWETKRWPAQYYGRLAAAIADALGVGVMITWGPGERDLVERAHNEVPPRLRERVHCAPPTSVRELAALLHWGRLMIGGDTGPVHLAAARGIPVLALYGGSDPARNGPLGPAPVRVLDNRDIPCYPCWQVHCDDPPPRCLTTIAPETVLDAARRLLDTPKTAKC